MSGFKQGKYVSPPNFVFCCRILYPAGSLPERCQQMQEIGTKGQGDKGAKAQRHKVFSFTSVHCALSFPLYAFVPLRMLTIGYERILYKFCLHPKIDTSFLKSLKSTISFAKEDKNIAGILIDNSQVRFVVLVEIDRND